MPNAERRHLEPIRTFLLLLLAVASLAGSIGISLASPAPVAVSAAAQPTRDPVHVRFVLDGVRIVDEALAPYDLNATAANGKANALDTRTLTLGNHTVQATVTMPEGVTYKYKAMFKVAR